LKFEQVCTRKEHANAGNSVLSSLTNRARIQRIPLTDSFSACAKRDARQATDLRLTWDFFLPHSWGELMTRVKDLLDTGPVVCRTPLWSTPRARLGFDIMLNPLEPRPRQVPRSDIRYYSDLHLISEFSDVAIVSRYSLRMTYFSIPGFE
jgi:hypothetical protein